tara:strand:+ start:120 stop:296 length:177 start_codon:yes stop_codon:yes gene_type:complete
LIASLADRAGAFDPSSRRVGLTEKRLLNGAGAMSEDAAPRKAYPDSIRLIAGRHDRSL